jgi:hypothetical protein
MPAFIMTVSPCWQKKTARPVIGLAVASLALSNNLGSASIQTGWLGRASASDGDDDVARVNVAANHYEQV